MEQQEERPKPSLPSGLAIIEKAQELRWTLQLACAVLFADLVLTWKTGNGISQWSANTDQLLANSGFLISGLLAFGVIMSIVMPLAGEIFRQISWALIFNTPIFKWMYTETDYRRPAGGVSPQELLDHALKNGDSILLDMHAAHKQKQSAATAEQFSAGQLVFAALTCAILDYFANYLGIQGSTLLQKLSAALGTSSDFVLLSGFGLGAFALKWAWFSERSPEWIYYPPLYEKIEAERNCRIGLES